MRFTMARPEVSCHPETLLEARARWSPRRSAISLPRRAGGGRGRLPRYTWRDEYSTLRERLDALGRARAARIESSSTTTTTSTGRRPCVPASRSTARTPWQSPSGTDRGSCSESSSPMSRSSPRRRSSSIAARVASASTRARRARSTNRESWTPRSASRTGRRRPRPIPEMHRAELGDRVYGCDICQDVCPWNRGGREEAAPHEPLDGARPDSSAAPLARRSGDELMAEFDRLYVPRNDVRWLRRNALIAAGNVGGRRLWSRLERIRGQRRPDAARDRAMGLDPTHRAVGWSSPSRTTPARSLCSSTRSEAR